MSPESCVFKRFSPPARTALPLPSPRGHFCRVFSGWAFCSLVPEREGRMEQLLASRPSMGTSQVVAGGARLRKGALPPLRGVQLFCFSVAGPSSRIAGHREGRKCVVTENIKAKKKKRKKESNYICKNSSTQYKIDGWCLLFIFLCRRFFGFVCVPVCV